MLRVRWRWIVLFTSVMALISAWSAEPVLACSGGSPLTLDKLINYADLIVQGRVEQVDDAHQVGLLSVENYLMGEPAAEQIVVSFNEPWRSLSLFESRYYGGGGCYYFAKDLYPGDEIIIFLTRNANGSYNLAQGNYSDPYFYRFNRQDEDNRVYLSQDDVREVDAAELTGLIESSTGQPPQPPQSDMPAPLTTPLLVTTVSGTSYLIPVDDQPPTVLTDDDLRYMRRSNRPGCTTAPCVGFAPNGVDSAFLTGDDQDIIEIDYTVHVPLNGQAFLFSSTSDALAIWNHNQLSVYGLYYPRLGLEDYQLTLMNTTTLVYTFEDARQVLPGYAAWSPDGRTLAYSDSQGVWLWDVFTPDSQPRLFRPLAAVQGFSQTGRYLLVTQNGETRIVDQLTATELPNGILSPDDRILLAYDTDSLDGSELFIHSLAPFRRIEEPHFYARQTLWKNPREFLMVACVSPHGTDCQVRNVPVGSPNFWSMVDEGYAFDYEPISDSVVVLQSTSTISINGQSRNLSSWLDDDIQSVEWLPSLFYAEP